MASDIWTVTVDCSDPKELARFWCEVLGYETAYADDDEVAIESGTKTGPVLLFLKVLDGKDAKNRIHLDLNPDDQAVEVERLKKLGAVEADIGQGAEVPWIVLADPEGNEFCVLTPR